MNIAFGALILLLLLIPGLFFRVAYLNVRYSGKTFKSTIIDETLLALAPAFIIQVCGFLFVEGVLHYSVSLSTIYGLIISSASFKEFEVLRRSLGSFLLYSLVLWAASWGLGYLVRNLIRFFRLDYKYPIFRFQNSWYPILKGTIVNFPGYTHLRTSIQLVWIDVIVETKEGSYIYSGIIDDFFLSKDEGLDRIYLKNVRRRKLTNEPNDNLELISSDADETEAANLDQLQEVEIDSELDALDKRYYYMPGDFFIIPYSQIKNMNIRYFHLDEES
jgi:hypothetical protein